MTDTGEVRLDFKKKDKLEIFITWENVLTLLRLIQIKGILTLMLFCFISFKFTMLVKSAKQIQFDLMFYPIQCRLGRETVRCHCITKQLELSRATVLPFR